MARPSPRITAASNPGLIVITSLNHGLQTGDGVFIQGVQGNTAANGSWVITVLNANQFSLNGSTANGPYLGDGTWQRSNSITTASGTAGKICTCFGSEQ